ncbi:(Fe-S)-binding protein [Hyperthermus butylicus]|uniref:Fe-S oxidoreductase n=1 Tax=Hyperthermus butylicus (strain DSM 5456 / JCM 9403 / PLM1-5) TaxID=415426 RepID=A2BMI3_HYPBU|nr:(Fe-S)-binding protein [Hyperthermus butylicus]ABM81194.1 Fe-S oxidoreductase [Hyperthermus butylicus DSM 5456]
MAATGSPVARDIAMKVRERISWSGFDKAKLDRAVAKFVGRIDVVKLHFLEACVGCGVCAPACPYYYVDERNAPMIKAEKARYIYRKKLTFAGRILGWLVNAKLPKSEKDLDEIVEAVYRCTNCGHCYLTCPFGIDSGSVIQELLKIVATDMGRVPSLIDFFAELERSGAFYEVPSLMEAWKAALTKAEEAIGKKLPYDKAGAEILLLPMLTDALFYPGAIAGAIKILEAAKLDYTVPSKPLGFRTPVAAVAGRPEAAKEALKRLVDSIEKLGVKTVVLLDGGFPYFWLRWKAPTVLGRKLDFKVLHIVELVDELISKGKLEFETADDEVTWHDPCQLVRRGGVVEEPYRVMAKVSRRFRPLPHHGVNSLCCGGGGGIGCMSMEMIKQFSSLVGLKPEDLISGEKEKEFIEKTEKAWAVALKRKIDHIRESKAKPRSNSLPGLHALNCWRCKDLRSRNRYYAYCRIPWKVCAGCWNQMTVHDPYTVF